MLPSPIKNFVAVFSKLPSIGPRQAMRLAFLIVGLGKSKIQNIADAVSGLADLTTCARCFRTHLYVHSTSSLTGQVGQEFCDICVNPMRKKNLIAIIEKETDLFSLEKTKKFNGWYLLIGELHKTGELEQEQKMRLESLKSFIKAECAGKADEIILAVNPTVYGDLNAALLKKELEPFAGKITRLARGIPTGGEIEFADEETLGEALDRRK